VYRFKCPACGRKCRLNKKLSDIRGREEGERVYQWECDGQSLQAPHPPTIYRVESLSVMTDGFGRVQSKIEKVTRLWIEDAELHELLDAWKEWMREKQYKHLTAQLPTPNS